ncbi:MAG: response regulator [Desulfobacterales bacterium]|nr:response regulator [Desulfobacterales bacterium]
MSAKILIVDDESNLLRLIGYVLQVEGYEIVTAQSGMEAPNKIQTEKPDLIILDSTLPDISGLEICQRLRRNSYTADLPIIMLSAWVELSDKIRGLEAGADEYITKPVDPDELVARVGALLSAKGPRRR